MSMTFFFFIISYLLGSLPSGLILSKILKKKDPRDSGSRNFGATNITRVSGWKTGLSTLILDVLKAFIPVKICMVNFEQHTMIASIGVFLGHIFPIWLKFKGGKGVAVLIGILFGHSIMYGLVYIFSWLFTAILTKYSSLSALISSLIITIFIFFDSDENFFLLLLILNIFIYFKHKENIIRLINNKEPSIKLRSK